MSERKLTEEQEKKLRGIMQEWQQEAARHFETYKYEEIVPNRLDGPRTCDLAEIQMKYKKKINEELGMDFYEDTVEVRKERHKKFLDMIVENPQGFPDLPKRK